MSESIWKLNSRECFEASGAAVLFFHNDYEEGKQGGVEILQKCLRIAGNGNIRLGPAPDQWAARPKNGARKVDTAGGASEITCEYEEARIRYTIRLAAEGEALLLTVDLERPLPPEWIGKAGFSLELIPGAYIGKSFHFDGERGIFPPCHIGPVRTSDSGGAEPLPLGRGRRLVVSPEEEGTRIRIESLGGEITILDGRSLAQNGWFCVRGLIPGGAAKDALQWRILPTVIPGWTRAPVICHSQIGYHPRQRKRAVIELDPSVSKPGRAALVRMEPDGAEKTVQTERLGMWGRYLHFNYAIFDFSAVTEEGIYRVEYDGGSSDIFPISARVLQDGAWQPTLETFFPVQMCHMEVRDAYRVWHGACHLDDALQAPPGMNHFDQYRQYGETETAYESLGHIPHMDSGGWHDAGDYDLAAGSQARTTLALALSRETFGLDWDQTTVDGRGKKVLLHAPDGIPDVVQQIAHGAENLLSGYRAAGHSFAGIIEATLGQYVHLGDAATATDNRVSSDDRWAFTNRDSAREYLVCAALAGASRSLRGWEDALAEECLETAGKIWAKEQSSPPKIAPNSYTPPDSAVQAILAASELLIATGEDTYRNHLVTHADIARAHMKNVGWAIARLLPRLDDAAFAAGFESAVTEYGKKLAADARANPFGVPFTEEQWLVQGSPWGIGWTVLSNALAAYFLHRAFPALVDPAVILDSLGYVLGCHPVSAASLVTGVGTRSLASAYGTNRADWTGIPGGVVSGPALIRPDYPELQDPFPFLWTQKEYVISGAATYLFCVLAAENIVNHG